METRVQSEEPALRRLREEFPGHRVWRGRRPDGSPGVWVATLVDRSAGIDATLVRPDAEALRSALVQERTRAGERDKKAR